MSVDLPGPGPRPGAVTALIVHFRVAGISIGWSRERSPGKAGFEPGGGLESFTVTAWPV